MNLKNFKKPKKISEVDRLFFREFNKVLKNSTSSFELYEYAKSKGEVDYFFWKVFADNYLEIVKNRVYNGTKEEKDSAFYTLYNILLGILKMMAPFTPFITEELYQIYFKIGYIHIKYIKKKIIE